MVNAFKKVEGVTGELVMKLNVPTAPVDKYNNDVAFWNELR